MNARVPSLTPYPLRVLLGRCAREWERDGALLGRPGRAFWRPAAGADLRCGVGGGVVATPAGLAAGPHTQLAGNLVSGWLAGARSFELKTVQILDQLEIPRPCIDAAAACWNVEWSQELRLDESRREYVAASMLLEVLAGWPALRPALGDPGAWQFELSVGYDLAGIAAPRMRDFIEGLRDAAAVVDELRREIPPPFAAWRDRPFATRLVHGATLSTFHGCPPGEIAAIARHLMTAHDLDVTVKLNPTLLGPERVAEILHARLGWREVALDEAAFAEDLGLDRAVALVRELDAFARARGRVFGVKLTNTLVARNTASRLPGERAYLSGPPLHALAVALLDELAGRLPGTLRLGPDGGGTVPVAFSAGVSRDNFADTVGLGLAPVTVCTDLLRPGGYGRLTAMLGALARAMRDAGCIDLPAWVARRHADARAAGARDAAAARAARLATPEGAAPCRRGAARPPRRSDAALALWDCCACDLCVSVCPNGAMLSLTTPADLFGALAAKRQLVCLAELCNACGNCETFCPERGAPFALKPRLFRDRDRFAADDGPAFLVAPAAAGASAPFAVTAAASVAGQAERLARLLNGPGGLPLRAEDLT